MDVAAWIETPLEHLYVDTNGVRLHVVQAGPVDGPLVLLLHGFPEFWFGWRKQIEPLVAAGYRVWIPDQRGYNRSEKPKGAAAYHIATLSADIAGLIEASGASSCALIGHDWGGVVAWSVASDYPHLVSRISVMNVPHIAMMFQHVTGNLRQTLKSWYIFAFQIPALAEFFFSSGRFFLMRKSLAENEACSETEIELYVDTWSQPKALTSMLHWYRACKPLLFSPPKMPTIELPMLLLWGAEDRYLGLEMGEEVIAYCPQGKLVPLPGVGHFPQHEAPGLVNAMLLEFLEEGREADPGD